ncbi:MAG TPA: hypothetical protein VJQ78_01925 [Sphingobium sp.]|nr:hypothetical protein [Sphingobium sp.]
MTTTASGHVTRRKDAARDVDISGRIAVSNLDKPEPSRSDRTTTADLARAGQTEAKPPVQDSEGPTPLLPHDEIARLQTQWASIQGSFVDEPRRAVEEADTLVAAAMKRLAETFASERSDLESQWDRGDNVSTEDLRVALQRYRAFFERLLSI